MIRLRGIRLWLLFGILAGAVCISIFSLQAAVQLAVSQVNGADVRPTIVLDPGHGGVDPGAIGVNGCKEKDINLAIALTLRDILTANGYTVVMTRETDIATNDPGLKRISQIKSSDIKNRRKLIEAQKDAITIMIHQNQYTEEKYRGAQMFYGKQNAESKPLAQAMQKAFQENLQPSNTRQVKPATKSVYLIYHTKNPIVLAECGFLSNYSETKLLCDEEYQRKVAFTLFCGIEYYRSGKSGENGGEQGGETVRGSAPTPALGLRP